MSAAKKTTSVPLLQKQISSHLSSGVVVSERQKTYASPEKTVVVTQNEKPETLIEHCLSHGVHHVCQAASGDIETEINTSALMLKTPQTFVDYPVSSILCPSQAGAIKENQYLILNRDFSEAKQKEAMLEKIRRLLLDLERPETLISDLVLMADEMFTNAVYNAPFVDVSTGYNPGIDRNNESVQITGSKSAQLMLGKDENRMVVACRDPFGSLDVAQFLERIFNCFSNGASATMRMGNGGAGIGSFMVFSMCSGFYVGVQKGKATVVAASVYWRLSARKRGEAAKNLHYFER